MAKSAYIKFVEESSVEQVSLQDVKEKLERYINMTTKTGQQLAWDYADAAFPYEIIEKPEARGQWFYLKGKNDKYKYIVFGVDAKQGPSDEMVVSGEGSDEVGSVEGSHEGSNEGSNEVGSDEMPQGESEEQCYIQVVLPEGATHGDMSKANEFCKYLAKEYQAQLFLFNGRLMYYYPRKP